MDAKITLSFNREVIEKAKKFASDQNMSLSRLTEFLYQKIVSGDYKSLDELPVSDWVSMLAEGEATYGKSKSRKDLKSSYFDAKK
ncbi:hypothetical protein IPZ59_01945 [Mongoliitalea daihaiensis]|nr:hypothetical protein IPZ59_01945 [Mongoliitalea daihaiensis]